MVEHNPDLPKTCKDFQVSLNINPIALRKTKIVYNFGLLECHRVKVNAYKEP